ncbi:abasic site processing protein HMCES-like isoform X2 [Gigantopelta aegis]|uniref:abasic site processing protein HMCES-like isoform X2 n=1 Tax=Gigantopelta aegis TaxID=1735272 RepID=UPI001B88CC66|nr:abasic site processing protein HMCES-like isoform X2 [Gigantopelta aegis]
MCGRTACTLAPDDVCQACCYGDRASGKKQMPVWRDAPGGQQYYPSHNIAPGSHTPVLISSQHYPSELSEMTARVVQPMKWGLTPSWHKGDPMKMEYETTNCRAEGMLTKKTYRAPLDKGRRCVVLADGFFEWKRDQKVKQPYFISFSKDSASTVKKEDIVVKHEDDELKHNVEDSDKRLLTMAGVFDIWKPPDGGAPIFSYSVITVKSSPAMSWIHDRMPAILTTDEEIEDWLNFSTVPLVKASKLIRPVECVSMYPVSTIVNNSRNKSPDCTKPIDLQKSTKTASSNFMMNWLKPKTKSDVKTDEPDVKKIKHENTD